MVSSVPSEIENFVLTTFFETVMFSFTAVNDIDLDSYAYELYDNELGEGTPIETGRNKANVFTVSVQNSSLSIPSGEVGIYSASSYWGRVAVVNSAGIVGSFTELVGGQPTPLIGDQYLDTLTAAKITAGTIGAHTITLAGANSIIQSSNYNPSTPRESRQGWFIDGQGNAEFSSAAIRGTISAQSIYLNSNNRWGRNNANTADSNEFKVGTDTSYLFYDFANNKVEFTGTITIGSSNNVFKADNNGIYLGNATFGSAPFRVTPAGALTATSAAISGTVSSDNLTATGGVIAGWGIDASGFTKVSGPNTTRVFHNNTSSPDFSARFLAQVETGGDTYRTSLNSTFVEAFSNVASVTNTSLLRPTGLETPSIITPNNGSLSLLTGRIASAQLVAENAIAKVGTFGTGGFSTMGISLAFGLSILTLSASTRDIKRNIEDSTYDEVEELLMNLRPVKFQYKYAPDADELTRRMSDEQVVYGFIAEEVADVNKTLAVFMPKSQDWWNREEITYETMTEDFKPSDWDQRAVTSLLVKGYQSAVDRINSLESRLQALEDVQ